MSLRASLLLATGTFLAFASLFVWWRVVEKRGNDPQAGANVADLVPKSAPSAREVRLVAGAAFPGDGLPTAGTERPPAAGAPTSEQRLAEVEAMIEEQGANPGSLAKAYADWANEPAAVPARRAALAALRTQAPPLARLSTLLSAVSAATAPSETDPLWPETVQAAAEIWTADNVQTGRDMMLAETKSRSRQLLVSSLAQYASTARAVAELSDTQKNGLRSDFIDVYREQSPAQQKAMEAAVRNIAGEHAAELLRGIAATP